MYNPVPSPERIPEDASQHLLFIMQIRPYRDSDLNAVTDLFTASVRHLAAPYYDPAQIAAWAPGPPDLGLWQQRLSRVTTLVAEHGHQLVGFISYRSDGHIDMLFTTPTYTRHGVASRLYRHVESELAAMGVTELSTEASLVARPFFEHHGFRVIEQQRVELRGEVFLRFAMVKQMRTLES